MSNYFVVNIQSNLIQSVIATSSIPASNRITIFIFATKDDIDTYYRLKAKLPAGECLDYGKLLSTKQKARTARSAVASPAVPWSRLTKFQREVHRADMLRQLRAGRSVADVAFIFRCTEYELRAFLNLDALVKEKVAA